MTKDPDQATYHYGDTAQLTATADAGWTFIGWSGNASCADNPVSVMIDGNTSVTATFGSMLLISPNGPFTAWEDTSIWTGINGPTYYILEVYDTNSGSMILRQWFSLAQVAFDSDTRCAVSPSSPALLANGSYRWRVQDYGTSYG